MMSAIYKWNIPTFGGIPTTVKSARRTVGAKGRVFPEALTQSALAGGGGCFSFGGTVQYIEESNIYLCFVVYIGSREDWLLDRICES